jgi:hypothetical protein
VEQDKPSLLSKLIQDAIGQDRQLGGTDDEGMLTYPRLWE